MSASEFAFLALGLLLGSASGAAFVVVFRSRPPAREVRVTMTHDAIPRRSTTLSTDAFTTAPNEPARGGPADRRLVDREASTRLPTPHADAPAVGPAPVIAPADPRPDRAVPAPERRTVVRDGVALVGIPVGGPRPDRGPAVVADRVAAANAAVAATEGAAPAITYPSALLEILRGDRATLVAVADAAAGPDRSARAAWESRLERLAAALTDRALELGLLDFPLGHPFWDDFTIDECRRIAATLAAAGHRFDGRSGWEGRPPTQAELSGAVVACGIQPTRVRSWPGRAELPDLYRGARIAWADVLAAVPQLAGDALRIVLGPRAGGLDGTWEAWEDVRPHLLAGARAAIR